MQRFFDFILPAVLVVTIVLSGARWLDDRAQTKTLFEKYDQLITALAECKK